MRCTRGLVIAPLDCCVHADLSGGAGVGCCRDEPLRGPVPPEHQHLPADGCASIPRHARARRLGRLTAVLVSALQA